LPIHAKFNGKHVRSSLRWPVCVSVTGIFLILSTTLLAADNTLEKSIETASKSNSSSAASQKKIDQLSDKTRELYNDYKSTLRELHSYKLYNKNLEDLIDSQKQEINSFDTQLAQIDDTQRDVIPLMIKMVDTLDEFIKLDQPFLLNERQNRVNELKVLMSRSDVATSEKYRRIMEAYQVEMEYGRTIEAYRGTLESNGENRTVNFFRLGRVALYYQTLDEQETGIWDRSSHKWLPLSSDYRLPVRKGLGIARKQAAPDLLLLPVSAPEQAK
jgi:hypothetical protein